MKFIAFFALVATVCATTMTTTIHPSTNILCGKLDTPISECGKNDLFDYNLNGAKIVYKGQPVIFYHRADCTGYGIYVEESIDCFELPIKSRCVLIIC